MTTIRSGAPRIASTQSATPAAATAAPAAAKSSTPAETASTFQAATGSSGGGSIRKSLDEGLKVLGELEGSEGIDTMKKVLQGGVPTGKDLNAAIDAYCKIANDLTPEQRKPLEKALSTQMVGRSMAENFKQQLEKIQQENLAALKQM